MTLWCRSQSTLTMTHLIWMMTIDMDEDIDEELVMVLDD
jgi:hypothetical protein